MRKCRTLELEQNTVAELEAIIEKQERVLTAMKEGLRLRGRWRGLRGIFGRRRSEWLRREQDFLDGKRERRVKEREEMRGTALQNLKLRVGGQHVGEDGESVKVKVQQLWTWYVIGCS